MNRKKFTRMVGEFPFLNRILSEQNLPADSIGSIKVKRGDRNLLEIAPSAWAHDAGGYGSHEGSRSFWYVIPGEVGQFKSSWHRWIDMHDIDWEKAYDWLEKGGVKTPAWVTTQWLEIITGKTLPESFIRKIEPSSLKKSYLLNWINKNYSTKFLEKPFLVKALFTLPVHDTFSDAIRDCCKAAGRFF